MTTAKVALITGVTGTNGTPGKLMSAERLLSSGWSPSLPLRNGIAAIYLRFLAYEAGKGAD